METKEKELSLHLKGRVPIVVEIGGGIFLDGFHGFILKQPEAQAPVA